jgi:hypothetical protein
VNILENILGNCADLYKGEDDIDISIGKHEVERERNKNIGMINRGAK